MAHAQLDIENQATAERLRYKSSISGFAAIVSRVGETGSAPGMEVLKTSDRRKKVAARMFYDSDLQIRKFAKLGLTDHLVYYIMQIMEVDNDPDVTIQALASAMVLLSTPDTNKEDMQKSGLKGWVVVKDHINLKTEERPDPERADRNVPHTIEEIRPLGSGSGGAWATLDKAKFDAFADEIDDPAELAGVIGVYAYAIGKLATEENISAFTTQRQKAVQPDIIVPMKIFQQFGEDELGSRMINVPILVRIHKAFNRSPNFRIPVLTHVVHMLKYTFNGPSRTFMRLFEYNENAGLGVGILVHDAIAKGGVDFLLWFQSLAPEFVIWREAWRRLAMVNDIAGSEPYMKFIYGDQIVVVNGKMIPNLFPLCRDFMVRFQPSIKNFGGPTLSSELADDLEQFFNVMADRLAGLRPKEGTTVVPAPGPLPPPPPPGPSA